MPLSNLSQIMRSGSKDSSSGSKSIRPSALISRPSAICAVMSVNTHKPQTSVRRDSVCSTSSVDSEVDATALIDNDMAKTFGASNSRARGSIAPEGKTRKSGYFTFTTTAAGFGSDMRQQAAQVEGPSDLETVKTPEGGFSQSVTASLDAGAVAPAIGRQRGNSVAAEMMRTIFGDHSSEVLRPHHQRLPAVLKQIFGSQHDLTVRRNSAGARTTIAILPPRNPTPMRQCMYRCRRRCGALMTNAKSQAFFIVLTLYALFGPDFNNWLARSEADDLFLIINTVVFGLFVVEIGLLAFGIRGWMFSVPAALDVIACMSFVSDTLLWQGNVFGNKDGEQTTRMARSTRMTRLVRVARVARVTKLVPRLIDFLGGHSNTLARHVLKRRLWRLFLFLDTEKRGFLTALDMKVVYLVMLQECPYLLVSQSKVNVLTKDLSFFTDNPRLKNLNTPFNFTEFTNTLTSLSFGKQLQIFHLQEVEKEDGVWSLTRKVSDGTALKICCGILIIFVTLTFLDTSLENESHVQGLAFVDFIVGKELKRSLTPNMVMICQQIRDYMDDHKVMLMFIANHTFITNSGAECVQGISRSELDPFKRVDEIMARSTKRASEVLLICWPEEGKCDDTARSAVLLDTEEEFRHLAMFSVITTSTILVLILIFILLFNRVVSRFSRTLLMPLRALVDDMHAMCSLDLVDIDADALDTVDTGEKVADEMTNLQRAFSKMRTAVRSWGKYVPPAIVQRLMTSGFEATIGVVRVQASILFVDIDDFEEVCRGLSPEETLNVLSTVLGKVADAIQENKGILLEFIGDEVLSVFNVPAVISHHTYHATKCAIEIHTAVEKISISMQDGRSIAVRCRTGVHTAQILAGNVGSKRRMKFGLLGDGVNLTARLKTLNSRYKTQTIVSDKVIDATLIDERFVWRPLEKVAVKGRKEATTVYEVLGLKNADGMAEFARLAQLHIQAFNLYHDREFVEAAKLCGEVRSLFEVVGRPDEPSRQLLKKCNRYIAEPPPPEWDGVERLQKKTFEVQNDDDNQEAKRDAATQDANQDENDVIMDLVQACAEEDASDSRAFEMATSMPSSAIPAPDEGNLEPSRAVSRSRRSVDVPSCWRHLLQVPHYSKVNLACPVHGRGGECCGMAGPQGQETPSSSFCGCNNMYSMPAIVVLPGPEMRFDPSSSQVSSRCDPEVIQKDSLL